MHQLGRRLWQLFFFFRSWLEPKKRKGCNASLIDSTDMEAIAVPAMLPRLELCLGVLMERCHRGYGSPILTQAVSFEWLCTALNIVFTSTYEWKFLPWKYKSPKCESKRQSCDGKLVPVSHLVYTLRIHNNKPLGETKYCTIIMLLLLVL